MNIQQTIHKILRNGPDLDTATINPGYVDAKYLEDLKAILTPLKLRSYGLMRLHPGSSVLDLGCGPGLDTIEIGLRVGAKGKVVGVDHDEQMVAIANRRAKEWKVADWCVHQCRDGSRFLDNDDTYDATRAERILQHVDDPEALFREMVRVTRPGGRIVVADTDYSSVSVDTKCLDVEWTLRKIRADRLKNGYAGRQLYGLFRKYALDELHVEAFPVVVTNYHLARYFSQAESVEKDAIQSGLLSQEDIDRLHEDLEQLNRRQNFFGYAVMVMVAGTKRGGQEMN